MINMFLSNNPSFGDINSSNLPCCFCKLNYVSSVEIDQSFYAKVW